MMAKDLLVDLAIRYGFQVLGAVVILVAGFVVARWTGAIIDRRLSGRQMDPPLRLLIGRAVRMVVLLFALVLALDKFGFQIAPLVAGIGVAGLGVGIALQGVLGNVMAGLTIIFTKPFRVGEYIEIVGVHGEVASIELLSTTLVHADRSRVIIPNRKLVGEILHNFGGLRQLHLAVTVPITTDLGTALAAVREIVGKNPRVLKDPVPAVGIGEVGTTGIKIGVHPWVLIGDAGGTEGELYRTLVEDLRARGITVGATPQEVRLLNGSSPAVARA